MFVGEIGFPRREFLYELKFWEINRIIRGYRRRDWLRNQMMAECTYAAMFAMRDAKGKTVKDLFPFLFDDDEHDAPDITDEEIAQLQAEMNAYNGFKNPQK